MKKQVTTDQAPKAEALLSQGIISNGLVFVSGQIPSLPDGTLVTGATEEKLTQTMKNIAAILEAAGSSLEHTVKVTVFVTDIALLAEINQTYQSYFTGVLPAREGICVKELPLGADIEISVVAELPK